MFVSLKPQQQVSSTELSIGLQMLIYDGICSQILTILTTGAFLVAFALMLGASNIVIGLIAALGPITQLLQIPTIYLIEGYRQRKALVVIGAFISRIFWLVIIVLPWLIPADYRITVFVICLFCHYGLGTIAGCGYNSWMRDLIPQSIMGDYFGKRTAISTAVGVILTLIAGFAVEWLKRTYSDSLAYVLIFLGGVIAGLTGVYFLSRIPEPQMEDGPKLDPVKTITEPLLQINFRRLLTFMGIWNFAINLATPFFVVYMLKRLGMRMDIILGLSVVSQIFNVGFVRIWGRLADRFSNKSVLSVSGSLFILSIFLWPFLTLPDKHSLTIPLLVLIHILSGISTAGVALTSSNIALKLAPYGRATAYLAVNGLVSGIGAMIAPIIAGIGADWFGKQQLSISMKWLNNSENKLLFDVRAFDLQGLDFVFMFAVIIGLYSMHRLLAVKEEGEVEEEIVIEQLWAESRKVIQHISNVTGVRHLFYYPFVRISDNKKDR